MLWKLLWDMFIFFYYLHYCKISPFTTCNIRSKVVVLHPPQWTVVWPLQSSVFWPTSSTHQRRLKLRQCLEIGKRRSHNKFNDVTWPSSYFTDRSVFYRPPFYRLVCKIVNLWDIDLKFLQSISDVNIDNCAKFC